MPVGVDLPSFFVNPSLERALLVAIAAKPELYFEVLDLLPPEALTETREVFEDIAEAIEKEKPLPKLDGEPASDPLAAAKELALLYQRRLLAALAQSFLDKLRGDVPTTELIADLEEGLAKVQQAIKELRVGQMVALPDLLPSLVGDVRARRQAVKEQGTVAVGLPTGIYKLDKLLGGLQPGLHLLAAEPGQGKTTFTLQIAAHVAQFGYPVLFVTFEESLLRLTLKVICAQAGLEAKKFVDGQGDPAELEQAAKLHSPKLATLYFVEGTARLTVSQIKARALQLMNKHKKNRCLVIVDYLQRWAASRRDFSEFRHVVSSLVSELRELALRIDSPILVISSQNRSGQGSASLVSLKESGDLEYSADTALFLVEAEKRVVTPPARAIDLVIQKTRFGDKGKVELIFKPDLGIFKEEAKSGRAG